jgi:vacuolar-type H+-ATPase subunit I/STV1
LSNRGIGLDQLAALNTNYSELQKENVARREELDTGNKTIADLQKQLGIFKEQQAQQAAQQQAQQAAQQQAAVSSERQRLQDLANQQAHARMKADQDRAYAAEGWIPSGVGWYKPGNADAGWIGARLQGR